MCPRPASATIAGMPRLGIVLAAAVLAGLLCAPASQAARARFDVTISGTFTSGGQDSEERSCYHEDRGHVPYTLTTTAREAVSFRSVRAGVVQFDAVHAGDPPSAGMLRASPGRVRTSRSATFSPRCRYDGLDEVLARCGQAERTHAFGIFNRTDRSAIYYQMVNRSGPVFPDSPLDGCPWFGGINWWSLAVFRYAAPVSRARIFNRRVPRISVTGRAASGGSRLVYTIDLRRRP